MKKLILILISIYLLKEHKLSAQAIPNSGFESWTPAGSYSIPDGWSTLNALSPAGNLYPCRKGTPGDPGSSFIDLSSQMGASAVLPGIAVSGKIDPVSWRAYQGFPCGSKPASLTGNWEFMARGADQGYVSVLLTRWNSRNKTADTIAYTKYKLSGMAMGWTSFTIPIHYLNANLPDSAIIVLSASGSVPVVNSYLYVDNLAFSGTATNVPDPESSISELQVYPIPVSDQVCLEFHAGRPLEVQIEILDILGRIVHRESAEVNTGTVHKTISANGLSHGVYFLRVQEAKGCIIRKIKIE
jgi:hypothetical protein